MRDRKGVTPDKRGGRRSWKEYRERNIIWEKKSIFNKREENIVNRDRIPNHKLCFSGVIPLPQMYFFFIFVAINVLPKSIISQNMDKANNFLLKMSLYTAILIGLNFFFFLHVSYIMDFPFFSFVPSYS